MESSIKGNSGADSNDQTAVSSVSNASLLGEVAWILSYSELHREWPIGSIQQWVFPALLHKQFRIYRLNGKPRGYVSWAWMSKEVEEAYVLNTASLKPADWKSGNRGWIVDYVAPFGDARAIAKDLRNNIFANDVGRILRVKKGCDTMKISYIHGAKAVSKARDWDNNPTVAITPAKD